ncbi:hypothetical protein GYA49_04540 [Candidatus Beckwithbacteria bacterium]|nr:hypothetical protein [Candidatus Beckwithbacteria bacterium]
MSNEDLRGKLRKQVTDHADFLLADKEQQKRILLAEERKRIRQMVKEHELMKQLEVADVLQMLVDIANEDSIDMQPLAEVIQEGNVKHCENGRVEVITGMLPNQGTRVKKGILAVIPEFRTEKNNPTLLFARRSLDSKYELYLPENCIVYQQVECSSSDQVGEVALQMLLLDKSMEDLYKESFGRFALIGFGVSQLSFSSNLLDSKIFSQMSLSLFATFGKTATSVVSRMRKSSHIYDRAKNYLL